MNIEDDICAKSCYEFLKSNLDAKNQSIWSILSDQSQQNKHRSERLFYLRFAVLLARILPFTDDQNEEFNSPNGLPKSKGEFLLNLWFTGRVGMVPFLFNYF